MQPGEARAEARDAARAAHGPRELAENAFTALDRWLLGFPAKGG